MIRVLFIARYRDVTMRRKLTYLAQQNKVRLWHVFPRIWEDALLRIEHTAPPQEIYSQTAVGMIGRPSDPHRALYRTLTFEMHHFRPDVIHAEEEPDSLAAWQITLARQVWAPQSKLLFYTWQNINRPRRWYVRWVLNTSLQACDAMLCASHEALDVLRQQGCEKPAWVLPAIGVDTETFRPCLKTSYHPGAFVIGYIGRLVKEKGVEILLQAVAQLCREGESAHLITLVIIGNGPWRASLEAQIKDNGLADHTRLLPAMPPAEIAQQICKLDVLVLPSKTTHVWKEQFGRVLIEAMACKIPVIGSNSGAIPEVIGDAGLIFPEGDAQALAKCLRHLRESPALRAELVERGNRRVQRFYTQEVIAAKTIEYYDQVLPSL